MFWAARLTAGSTAGDPADRAEGELATAGAVRGRGEGIDTVDVAVGLVSGQARGGGTRVVDLAAAEE